MCEGEQILADVYNAPVDELIEKLILNDRPTESYFGKTKPSSKERTEGVNKYRIINHCRGCEMVVTVFFIKLHQVAIYVSDIRQFKIERL